MTLIIAHRGASSERPENTIAAFKRAIELGADGIEFDVNIDDDGTPIVVHDFNNGAKHAPTLSETLFILAKHDLQLVIEIKPQGGLCEVAAETVGSLVNMFTFGRPPVLSSSSFRVLSALKKHHPRLKRVFVMRQPYFCFLRAELFAKLAGIEGIHANMGCASTAFVSWCHRRGLHLYCWTAISPEDVDIMLMRGVDGIIADDVKMANDSLKRIP